MTRCRRAARAAGLAAAIALAAAATVAGIWTTGLMPS